MRAALLLLALLVGCAEPARPAAPHVFVVGDEGPVLPSYVEAANAWSPLGFEVSSDDSGLPECGTDWWKVGDVACQISIYVWIDPLARAKTGSNAFSIFESNTIEIDTSLTDPFMLSVALAHEFGHLLLETTTHTPTGIMSGTDNQMSSDDRALACSAIRICI